MEIKLNIPANIPEKMFLIQIDLSIYMDKEIPTLFRQFSKTGCKMALHIKVYISY